MYKIHVAPLTSREFLLTYSPLQTTEAEPVFVNPVLQIHLTSKVAHRCVHIAFASQPPFFTVQLSRKYEMPHKFTQSYSLRNAAEVLTFARNIGSSANICKASLADALGGVGYSVERTH
jgi:hypothetical protein